MSLLCGRCKTKVNVIGDEEELGYIKHNGIIFCNRFCFKHRFVPMDLRKYKIKNKVKLRLCNLHIIENTKSYYSVKDIVGPKYINGVENMLYTVDNLDSTFTLKYFIGCRIKQVILHIDATEKELEKINLFKDRVNGIR